MLIDLLPTDIVYDNVCFLFQPSVGQSDGEPGTSQGPGFVGLPGGLNAPHQSLGLGITLAGKIIPLSVSENLKVNPPFLVRIYLLDIYILISKGFEQKFST